MCSNSRLFLPAAFWATLIGFAPLGPLTLLAPVAWAADLGLEAPPGFEVSQYAGGDLLHNCHALTIDAQGRVVVAGPGYVKTLRDDNDDGAAERFTLFSATPASGAHGLCFDGPDLICTGDNAVARLRDADGDGASDGPPEVWANLRHPDHGANGLVRGPDGWFHLICGNDAGVADKHAATPGSPVRQPHCGAWLRFSPDGKTSEVLAHGFRNPYDLDFNAAGHAFTYEADGERDQHLPWYSPTRVFDMAIGAHHGWVLQGWTRSWNRPPEYFDNVERLVNVGRGSPTGVTTYRHRSFPAKYRDGLFAACWSLGRVYFCPLTPRGAGYAALDRPEVFLKTTGQVGFAPVDVAVGPAGDLFVAIGGRGTRGGVFRVRYVGTDEQPAEREPAEAAPARDDALAAVLDAPQPQASWSRAAWLPAARKLGAEPFRQAALDGKSPPARRARAIEVLVDVFDGVPAALGEEIARRDEPASLARAAWALGLRGADPAAEKLLARLTHHADPRVARAAWEALAGLPAITAAGETAHWETMALGHERRLRFAAHLVDARRTHELSAPAPGITFTAASRPADVVTELWRLRFHGKLGREHLATAAEAALATSDPALWQEAIRLSQLCLGDIYVDPARPEVYAGYSANDARPLSAAEQTLWTRLAARFPIGAAAVDRELARLLAAKGETPPDLLERVADQWNAASRVTDDIHYLIVLSRLPGTRSERVTKQTAAALAGLHRKLKAGELYPSRNWPLRVGETFDELLKRDPALAAEVASGGDFVMSEYGLFVPRLPAEARLAAARRLAEALADADDSDWTSAAAAAVGLLPPAEARPALRQAWGNYATRDAVLKVLAEAPDGADRARFVAALGFPQNDSVEQAAKALTALAGSGGSDATDPAEIAAALAALRRFCAVKEFRTTRVWLVKLLRQQTGQDFETVEGRQADLLADYEPWFAWFRQRHPEAAAKLAGPAGADAETWRRRVAGIPWDSGDAARGRLAFERRSCAQCHSGASRFGPDLAGVGGRFSNADLLTAIVEPNKDVAPPYQTTLVLTASGKNHHGMIVYESPEATLLQVSADTTIRVAGEEIIGLKKSALSLMPTGLLNEADDQEIADLTAYLKSLTKKE